MKKIVVFIVSILFPLFASSYNFMVDNILYTIISSNDNTVEVSGNGTTNGYPNHEYKGDLIIPSTVSNARLDGVVETYRVTKIGNYAFDRCTNLTSVIIPNSVTVIGSYAFRGCTKLSTVAIPESVKFISWYAFSEASASTVIIPSTSKMTEEGAGGLDSDCFKYSNVKNVYCYSSSLVKASASAFQEDKVADATLHVPADAIEEYKATAPWSYFGTIKPLPPFVTITMNKYGSGTYCSEYPLDFTMVEGLKAYTATGYNNEREVVTLTRVNTAKRRTGLFLKGAQGTYDVPALESSADHMLNLLVGTWNEVEVDMYSGSGSSKLANYKYTVLPGDTEPQFYQFEENSTLSAGKAYLQLPILWLPVTVNAIRYRFDDGEDATDIPETEMPTPTTDIAYDLTGRRVMHPQKGSLYIINGKKVVY